MNPIQTRSNKRKISSNSNNQTKKTVQVPVIMQPDSSTQCSSSQNQPSEMEMDCQPSCSSSHVDANVVIYFKINVGSKFHNNYHLYS